MPKLQFVFYDFDKHSTLALVQEVFNPVIVVLAVQQIQEGVQCVLLMVGVALQSKWNFIGYELCGVIIKCIIR